MLRYIYSSIINQDKVGIRVASIIPVIITVSSFTPTISGQISNVQISPTTSGVPVEIDTYFKNTSNGRISTARDTMTLTDASGNQLMQTVSKITSPSILPTFTRIFTTNYSQGLSVGNYTVKSEVRLDNGTVLDSKTINFAITAPTTTTSTSTTTTSSTTSTTTTTTTPVTTQSTAITTGTTTTVTNPTTSATVSTATTQETTSTTNPILSPGELVITPITSLPGIDPATVTVTTFTSNQPLHVDAKASALTEVTLNGVSGAGTVSVGAYKDEPIVSVPFSAGAIKGGTGKPAVKTVDVQATGYDQGNAQVTVYYTNDEISGFDTSSLFLAYYYAGSWHRCDNIVNSPDTDSVSGNVPVIRLSGTPVTLGGALIPDVNTVVPVSAQYGNGANGQPGFRWSLVAVILAPIIVIGVIIALIVGTEKRKRLAGK